MGDRPVLARSPRRPGASYTAFGSLHTMPTAPLARGQNLAGNPSVSVTKDEVALPSLPLGQWKDQVEYSLSTNLQHCDLRLLSSAYNQVALLSQAERRAVIRDSIQHDINN